jgi:peptide/nickel transport system substrate-binding protein/oligopeptide transport system substrate-binding protein
MTRLLHRRLLSAFCAVLALAGCGSADDSTLNLVAIGDPGDPFETGSRLSPIGQTVRGATVEGLVGFDEQARVIPALADRWIVTDDGLSYDFRLRDGTWPDASPITATSARVALEQALQALDGTALGADLSAIDEVRMMAGRVIEIRLSRPMPNLLQLLAQPELGMVWKRKGSGPMRLRREANFAVLQPIAPQSRGLPEQPNWAQQTRTLRLIALPATQAVSRFNSGDADVLLGGRIESFPLATSMGISRGTIQLDPVIGLFGLSVARSGDFLAAPENREALAMAIDRDGLIAAFGVSGWTPSTRIVSPGVEGDAGLIGARWSDVSLDKRRETAAARVQRWRAARGNAPRLSLSLPEGPGSDVLFERLRQDFGKVGIELRRVEEGAAADLRLLDVVARYPRASWFFNQLSCAARRGLCSASADQRAAEARAADNLTVQATLLADAEAELTAANVFIPFGPPIRWSLVRGSVTGFATNRWGLHPLMPMAMRTR